MSRFKHIIFDCDGVLVDSEILANRVEFEIKNELGFPITLEEQILKFTGCGMTHPTMVEELARLPKDYWDKVVERCNEIYKTELKAIDGVIDVLTLLNVPKCIASSSEPENIEKKLKVTHLEKFFPTEAIFHGRSVKNLKPAPDLFLHALQEMNWKAEDCLVIEDSEHGVRAGRAAGLTVCGFTGAGHIYPGHADKLLEAGAHFITSNIRNILHLI